MVKNICTYADFVKSPRKLEKLAKMLNYVHFLKKNEKMIKLFVKIKKSILTTCFAFFEKQ